MQLMTISKFSLTCELKNVVIILFFYHQRNYNNNVAFIAYWKEGNNAVITLYNGYPNTDDSFLLSPNINGATAVVTATKEAVTAALNGVSVGCSYQAVNFTTLTIKIGQLHLFCSEKVFIPFSF